MPRIRRAPAGPRTPGEVDSPASRNPAREAARTVSPAARAAATTRLPVRPDAPVTTTVARAASVAGRSVPAYSVAVSVRRVIRVRCVMPASQLPGRAGPHRRTARPRMRASTLPPWTHSQVCWTVRGRTAPS
ncbi:hypothetical protein GCM10010260_19950 [Streptomyces filipinensis]|uniref:Uncharacterized protein n=1 Tax=Streptomyces filipinensis TaxID=66887 RepID=A0A918IA24_9ACTN|nr:hypothetical protein GCM10010260_19950 [Streptomyces filipinensis]